MLTKDGAEIPDQMLIGVTPESWVVQLFYDDEAAAAEWLSAAGQTKRRVFRVKLSPLEELAYVPPVPATTTTKSVELF